MLKEYSEKIFPYEGTSLTNEEKQRLAEEPQLDNQLIVQRHDALEKMALSSDARPL